MARKKCSSRSSFTVGNCKIEVEGGGISWETPNEGFLAITCRNKAKINISVNKLEAETHNTKTPLEVEELSGSLEPHGTGKQLVARDDLHFHLVNPDNMHDQSKILVQEILHLYRNELPSMNCVADTRTESSFLRRRILNGKYRTMALRLSTIKGSEEVIAAMSFQILPVDTLSAEIPLAAVSTKFQHKGFGCLLYEELRKRLYDIGVISIFCWADKESEEFWVKQGFSLIGTVNSKGGIGKLPIKSNIRKALSFPGNSILMAADAGKQSIVSAGLWRTSTRLNSNLPAKALVTSRTFTCKKLRECSNGSQIDFVKEPTMDGVSLLTAKAVPELPMTGVEGKAVSVNKGEGGDYSAGTWQYPYFGKSFRKRSWETSISSIKSKRIKAGCSLDFDKATSLDFPLCNVHKFAVRAITKNSPCCKSTSHMQGTTQDENRTKSELNCKECPKIMLMNIADQAKKEFLAKIIEKLGGCIVSEGSLCTHVITGKARRTMNFCVALCSGAWVLSSNWLKESYKMGRFQDESRFLLEDPDYTLRYKGKLSEAVAKARTNPCSLLKGYQICITKHVQPCYSVLFPIIEAASGTVIRDLVYMLESSKTIFLTCEEDIDEALEASKQGLWTYGSEWFMSCVMKQELDFHAPQFAESL